MCKSLSLHYNTFDRPHKTNKYGSPYDHNSTYVFMWDGYCFSEIFNFNMGGGLHSQIFFVDAQTLSQFLASWKHKIFIYMQKQVAHRPQYKHNS